MRFVLLDRVLELEPGKRITAAKNLTLAEEYLADHFPGFPVMPGVMMLQAMTEAGAWLVRASEDFAHSVITLREARNVKYGSFVEPGQTLVVSAELLGWEPRLVKLKVQGTVEGTANVSARLVLERYNLATERPDRAEADAVLIGRLRELWAQLCRGLPSPPVDAPAVAPS